MTEPIVTRYKCSACGETVTSEGTEALDHMVSAHGVDPDVGPQTDTPYLIPEESNPTDIPGVGNTPGE